MLKGGLPVWVVAALALLLGPANAHAAITGILKQLPPALGGCIATTAGPSGCAVVPGPLPRNQLGKLLRRQLREHGTGDSNTKPR